MLRRWVNGLVDIIYPKACVVCKNKIKGSIGIDNLICLECWGKIKRNVPPFCRRCGRQLKDHKLLKNICLDCIKKPLHFDRAFSPCFYEGVIKELIHEFKYKNKDYLGVALSRLMIEFIKEYELPMGLIDWVVPVPLSEARMREREFNQADILGSRIASEFNKKLLNNKLIRHRHTKAQADLGSEERLLNVKGSFSIKERDQIKAKNILLIDDVLTTGATSSEAASTLKDAGANIVFVLTLAN
jgi:ComF family protein